MVTKDYDDHAFGSWKVEEDLKLETFRKHRGMMSL